MTQLYQQARESKPALINLSVDHRLAVYHDQRAIYNQVIAMAQSMQEKCARLLPELKKQMDVTQLNIVNAPLGFITASDQHYALQESMKVNDFFIEAAQRELVAIDNIRIQQI